MGTQGKGNIASTRVLMIPLKDMMGNVIKVHPGWIPKFQVRRRTLAGPIKGKRYVYIILGKFLGDTN